MTAQLRSRLFAAAFCARWFVTLTMDPARLGDRDIGPTSYREQTIWLRRAFTRWIARLRRCFGVCKYVRIAEFQRAVDWKGRPNGRLHLHVLLETAAYGLFLRYSAEELGFGCQLDVQLVREVDDTYSYLRKYMTKGQPESYEFRVRRFSASRGVMVPAAKEPSEGRWALSRWRPEQVDWVAETAAAEVEAQGERRVSGSVELRKWLEFDLAKRRLQQESRHERRRAEAAFWAGLAAESRARDGPLGSVWDALWPSAGKKQSSFWGPPSMGSHGER